MSTPNDHDRTVTIPIERGVRAEVRPFALAVDGSREPSMGERTVAVWRLTLDALFGNLVDRWRTGTSIDPFDGLVTMVVEPTPRVSIEFDAPSSPPDPMHLRSVMHLAEGLRPAIRREGPVSDHALDNETARVLRAAADRFPLLSTPDPVAAAATLSRITARWYAAPDAVAIAR